MSCTTSSAEMSVKEFEIVLEQSGKLLTKRLRPYFASNRQADKLTFKNAFRHAGRQDQAQPLHEPDP